jgi:hypothetical protein
MNTKKSITKNMSLKIMVVGTTNSPIPPPPLQSSSATGAGMLSEGLLFMTPRNNKRPTTGAPGVKLLISVSAMAAALGGWALLSHKEPQALANEPAPTNTATATTQPTSAPAYLDFNFAPIPTLEPVTTIVLPTEGPTLASKPVVIYITPTPAAAPVVQAPGLRVVDAPPPPPPAQPQSQPAQDSQPQASNNSAPPPVTNTQSSQG